jgi:hypothetical protein
MRKLSSKPCIEPMLVQQKRVAMSKPKVLSALAGAAVLASSAQRTPR